MSKGGGAQQTVDNAPWEGVQPYLRDLFGRAQDQVRNPPEFYPGQTYVSQNPYESAGLQGQAAYAQNLPALTGSTIGTNLDLLQGKTGLGSFSDQFANTIREGLSPTLLQAQNVNAPQIDFNPQTPKYQVSPVETSGLQYLNGVPQIDVNRFAPDVGTTVNQDPNAAIASMLSGNPDTRGFTQALQSAFQPTLDIFNEQVLPGVRDAADAATGGQGGSGELKGATRAAERLARDFAQTAGSMGYQAYRDAQNRQSQGANLATQAGLTQTGQQLQGYGIGGQLGTSQAGLGAGYQALGSQLGQGYDLANLANKLSYDQLNAGTGLSYDQLLASLAGQNAGLNMQGQLANQSNQNQLRGDILGAAGTAGNQLGTVSTDQFRALAQMPGSLGLGNLPNELMSQVGQGYRGFDELALQDAMNRFNYNQNIGKDMLPYYAGLLQPGLGFGTQTQTAPDSNPVLGAIGGGLGGAGAASLLGLTGPAGWAVGGLGALLGAFG